VDDLHGSPAEVVRRTVVKVIQSEVLQRHDVQIRIGPIMLIGDLRMIVSWTTIVICPMILTAALLQRVKRALRFDRERCLTETVGLVAVVVAVDAAVRELVT
jgi:hypothetical protein